MSISNKTTLLILFLILHVCIWDKDRLILVSKGKLGCLLRSNKEVSKTSPLAYRYAVLWVLRLTALWVLELLSQLLHVCMCSDTILSIGVKK